MSMTTPETTTAKKNKTARAPRNGVDTPTLLATINAVGEQPPLARFKFRASNKWIAGTHSQSRVSSFYGAGGEHEHKASFVYDADHPNVLVGADNGPTPVEFVLVALASCLTAGIANIAATRGVTLTEVESIVEGDIDLQGIFGQPRRSGTATSRSASASRSRATHLRTSSARSSRSRARGRRSSTSSPTRCR